MAPPLGTPELQKELADIARRIVEYGKVSEIYFYMKLWGSKKTLIIFK